MARTATKMLALTAMTAGALAAARAAARRRRRIDFAGRVAIVTGGSRGLGLLIARQLVEQGARVAICARDQAELDRARQDLERRGSGEVLAVACDVSREDEVRRFVDRVEQRFGRIDVLINNAGVIEVGPVETMTLGDFDEAMGVHFRGPLHMTLAVLPGMRERRDGRIVNVTSIAGKLPAPHLVPYTASKYALVGFSEALRTELMKAGVYVTTVCPGLMRTGSPRNAIFKGQHRAEYAWFKIGDSIPGLSMNAARAASQILDACRHGDAEAILSLPAKLGIRFHNLMPGLSMDLAALVNRLLPEAGGIGQDRAKGYESTSRWSESPLSRLTDQAARRNNEGL